MKRRGTRQRQGYRRYHVQVRGRRTTVTLDKNLSGWLAIRLGTPNPDIAGPEDGTAHRVVRDWMQAELDRAEKLQRVSVSSWLFARALETVVDPQLKDQAIRW